LKKESTPSSNKEEKMRKPTGYDDAQTYSDGFQKLPPGGYVVEIKNAVLGKYNDGGEYLRISFDITEGEYRDFYTNQYKQSTFEPKEYKGRIRLSLPKEDGTEKDGWTLRSLKTNLTAIEESNNGYTWDWNEKTLIGKTAGLLFRNKEYNYNGNHGFWTEPFRFIAAEKVRSGDFTRPKDKLLNEKAPTNPALTFQPLEEDPPF
jgi:hypothetical protein